jgi:hypothetical protein
MSEHPIKDSRSLGATHRRRDEAAASIAREQDERDSASRLTSLARWPAIVAAIKAMVAAYNEGAGRELLVVAETPDQQQPSVTIESTRQTSTALVATLDAGEIRVDRRSTSPDAGGIRRWVDLTRSDDDTARYVLQEWMEQL